MEPIEKDFKDGTKLLAMQKTEGKPLEIRVFSNGSHLGCCTYQDAQAAYDENGQASQHIGEATKARAARFALLVFALRR